MRSYKKSLALCLVGLVIGLVISIQYKAVNTMTGKSLLASQKAQELLKELENLKNEKNELYEIAIKLDDEISKYEEMESDGNLMINKLQEDLVKYRIVSGQRAVEGSGISITIIEPVKEERYPIVEHGQRLTDILLYLINILNSAGAEAIAVNEQRYITTTEINYMLNGLYINSSLTPSPIEIIAVGNSDTLYNALNLSFGLIWEMNREGYFKTHIKKQNNIVVPRYNKTINYKYAKPIF